MKRIIVVHPLHAQAGATTVAHLLQSGFLIYGHETCFATHEYDGYENWICVRQRNLYEEPTIFIVDNISGSSSELHNVLPEDAFWLLVGGTSPEDEDEIEAFCKTYDTSHGVAVVVNDAKGSGISEKDASSFAERILLPVASFIPNHPIFTAPYGDIFECSEKIMEHVTNFWNEPLCGTVCNGWAW